MFPYWGDFFQKGEEGRKKKVSTFFLSEISLHKVTLHKVTF